MGFRISTPVLMVNALTVESIYQDSHLGLSAFFCNCILYSAKMQQQLSLSTTTIAVAQI